MPVYARVLGPAGGGADAVVSAFTHIDGAWSGMWVIKPAGGHECALVSWLVHHW